MQAISFMGVFFTSNKLLIAAISSETGKIEEFFFGSARLPCGRIFPGSPLKRLLHLDLPAGPPPLSTSSGAGFRPPRLTWAANTAAGDPQPPPPNFCFFLPPRHGDLAIGHIGGVNRKRIWSFMVMDWPPPSSTHRPEHILRLDPDF